MINIFKGNKNFNRRVDFFYTNFAMDDMSQAFLSCTNYNQTTVIPKQVTNISSICKDCINLDSNIIFKGHNIINMSNMLSSCGKYSNSINIPNTVKDMSNAFNGCFNIPVFYFENGAIPTNWHSSFRNTHGAIYYEDKILDTIPDGAIDIGNAFRDSSGFSSMNIPSTVTDISHTFENSYCSNLMLEDINVTDMPYSFANLKGNFFLRKEQKLPSHLTNMTGTFMGSSIKAPFFNFEESNNLKSMTETFSNSNLGIKINIPASVINVAGCFKNIFFNNSASFEKAKKINNFYSCFYNTKIYSDINLISTISENIDFRSCFENAKMLNNYLYIQANKGYFNYCFYNAEINNVRIVSNVLRAENSRMFVNSNIKHIDLTNAIILNNVKMTNRFIYYNKLIPGSVVSLPANYNIPQDSDSLAFKNIVKVCSSSPSYSTALQHNNFGAREWTSHIFNKYKNIAPSCNSEGMDTTFCYRCNGILRETATQKIFHNFINGKCSICNFIMPNNINEYFIGEINDTNYIIQNIKYNMYYEDIGSLIVFPNSVNNKNTIIDCNAKNNAQWIISRNKSLQEAIPSNIVWKGNFGFDLSNIQIYNNDFTECFKNTFTPFVKFNSTLNNVNLSSTFLYCEGLKAIKNLPSNITNLYHAFDGCINLEIKDIDINFQNVSNVDYAFYDCKNIDFKTKNIILSNKITSLQYTFANCANLFVDDIFIPSSVTNIYRAFTDSGIKGVTIEKLQGELRPFFPENININVLNGGNINQCNNVFYGINNFYTPNNYLNISINNVHSLFSYCNLPNLMLNIYCEDNSEWWGANSKAPLYYSAFDKVYINSSNNIKEIPLFFFSYDTINVISFISPYINSIRFTSPYPSSVNRVCVNNTDLYNAINNWSGSSIFKNYGMHEWENIAGISPNCIVDGRTGYMKCKYCNYEDKDNVLIIPKLGHSFINNVCTQCNRNISNIVSSFEEYKIKYNSLVEQLQLDNFTIYTDNFNYEADDVKYIKEDSITCEQLEYIINQYDKIKLVSENENVKEYYTYQSKYNNLIDFTIDKENYLLVVSNLNKNYYSDLELDKDITLQINLIKEKYSSLEKYIKDNLSILKGTIEESEGI